MVLLLDERERLLHEIKRQVELAGRLDVHIAEMNDERAQLLLQGHDDLAKHYLLAIQDAGKQRDFVAQKIGELVIRGGRH